MESHVFGLVPEELRRLPGISDETAMAAADCHVLTPRQHAEIEAVINAVRAAKIRKRRAFDGYLPQPLSAREMHGGVFQDAGT